MGKGSAWRVWGPREREECARDLLAFLRNKLLKSQGRFHGPSSRTGSFRLPSPAPGKGQWDGKAVRCAGAMEGDLLEAWPWSACMEQGEGRGKQYEWNESLL